MIGEGETMSSPAVLFYTSDFLTGVLDLTMEERGQYITLLCFQHQKGHLKEETIRLLVGNVSVNVLNRFKQDENGYYYNERMEIEKIKRECFVNSRKENGKNGGRPKKASGKPNEKPLGLATKNLVGNDNDNENINEIINKNIIVEIIDYLNNTCNTKYKYNTKKTISCINARFKEGFTLEDFKIVISKKARDWLGTEYEKFLRPETLFGTKFESYLNQKARELTTGDLAKVMNWEEFL